MTTSLTDFLLARIAEDEAVAQAAQRHAGHADDWADDWVTDVVPQLAGHAPIDVIRYLAGISPSRVLTECATKRRLIDSWADWDGRAYDGWTDAAAIVLPALALPYADHPDYDDSWRP